MYLQILSTSDFEPKKQEADCCQANFPLESLFSLILGKKLILIFSSTHRNRNSPLFFGISPRFAGLFGGNYFVIFYCFRDGSVDQ